MSTWSRGSQDVLLFWNSGEREEAAVTRREVLELLLLIGSSGTKGALLGLSSSLLKPPGSPGLCFPPASQKQLLGLDLALQRR